jgi:hypothetical protein
VVRVIRKPPTIDASPADFENNPYKRRLRNTIETPPGKLEVFRRRFYISFHAKKYFSYNISLYL